MRIMHRLLEHQRRVLKNWTRTLGFISGRGVGKTYIGGLKTATVGFEVYPERVLVGGTTQKAIERAVVMEMQKNADKLGFDTLFNVRTGTITWRMPLPSGKHRLGLGYVHGFRDPRSRHVGGRGPNFAGGWLDEARDLDREVYEITKYAIRVGRGPRQLLITSTPFGEGDWMEGLLVDDVRRAHKLGRTRSLITGVSTASNYHLGEEFIRERYESMDPVTLEREFFGKWVSNTEGRAVHMFKRDRHVAKAGSRFDLHTHLPLLASHDFGSNNCATLWQWDGKLAWAVDEVMGFRWATGAIVMEYLRRHFIDPPPEKKVKRWFTTGDATGISFQSGSQFHNWEIIRKILSDRRAWVENEIGEASFVDHANKWRDLNHEELTPVRNPDVWDTLTLLNGKLHRGEVMVNERCVELIRDLERTRLEEGRRKIDKSVKDVTHLTDTARYAVKTLYYHDAMSPEVS